MSFSIFNEMAVSLFKKEKKKKTITFWTMMGVEVDDVD